MLVEDCPKSREAVAVAEPHFPVFPEFYGASYGKRYELLLRRLARERLYDSAALVLATAEGGACGKYSEPAPDLTMRGLLAGLVGHAAGFIAGAQP